MFLFQGEIFRLNIAQGPYEWVLDRGAITVPIGMACVRDFASFEGCTWKGILTGGNVVDCAMEANLRTTTQLDTVHCKRSSKMSLLSCPYCPRGLVRMKSFCWACATLSFAILREKRLLQGHSNSGSPKPVLAILCQKQAESTGNMHVFSRTYIPCRNAYVYHDYGNIAKLVTLLQHFFGSWVFQCPKVLQEVLFVDTRWDMMGSNRLLLFTQTLLVVFVFRWLD